MCSKKIGINIWNPATCSCENIKYVGSIIGNSLITCDEVIEMRKTIPANFNEKDCNLLNKKFYINKCIISVENNNKLIESNIKNGTVNISMT